MVLLLALLIAAGSAAAPAIAAPAVAIAAGEPEIIARSIGATPPAAPCDASAFGARGDNATDDTAALAAALASTACSSLVLRAPGLYLSHALDLSAASARALVIERGAALVVWRNRSSWDSPGKGMLWQSRPDVRIDNFSISGGGVIFGGGRNWWPPANEPDKHLQFRPHTLFLDNVSNFSMTDVSIIDSPACNIQVNGDDLFFARVTIAAAADECKQFAVAPNTGGFRLSGARIVVRDSTVHNGDDCVPINPRPVDPANASSAWGVTEDVLVTNVTCACGTNGPVVFSPGGTVRNVTFEHMLVRDTFQGAGVKVATNSGAGSRPIGGVVANITYSDIEIRDPINAALYTDVFHQDVSVCALPSPLPANATDDWLLVANVTMRNIVATVPDGQAAGCFVCAPGARKCAGWSFDNVTVARHDGAPAAGYECIYFRNATATGSTPAPCGV